MLFVSIKNVKHLIWHMRSVTQSLTINNFIILFNLQLYEHLSCIKHYISSDMVKINFGTSENLIWY